MNSFISNYYRSDPGEDLPCKKKAISYDSENPSTLQLRRLGPYSSANSISIVNGELRDEQGKNEDAINNPSNRGNPENSRALQDSEQSITPLLEIAMKIQITKENNKYILPKGQPDLSTHSRTKLFI
ncbi:hypothetical protein O6H91_18G044500 [Diphasiastrum complanatum]|uniref:Uncharacterized protein n=1 Tax=Diphasiastrum complanatum TaxID=34168 RepID=A0ACC2B0K2_DIPCM|nr:hypothetical protein O6H91_18G044500 [Diphasiastrum complanatum]